MLGVATKVYRLDRWGGGLVRGAAPILFTLFILLLLYLFLAVGSQRAVLLGSDARAGEASRSDTIMIATAAGGLLAVPRDTLVEIPGLGEDKVNAAFAHGGPGLTVETL
jgi:anionic cell wall polymer biosynthesis LytR-Cps2A-Psr (LCP) family protein